MKNIKPLYPSLSRKALTFTIDDGNMKYDKMLLDILEPAGIKGTFNLCSNIHTGREDETRAFYEGYGIANHIKHHPFVKFDDAELKISPDAFDEETADPAYIYTVDGKEGFFWQIKPNGWRQMVMTEDFLRYISEGQSELRAIFGENASRDLVWPYGTQNNAAAEEYIRRTHRSCRKTGCTLDKTNFALPEDMYAWSYNANDGNILEVMERYDAYSDDGELKFFAFGVHSVDFERSGTWGSLRTFAERYGDRPDDYWYASVEDIFDYKEAIESLVITDSEVKNPSPIKVYLEIDGNATSVEPFGKLTF